MPSTDYWAVVAQVLPVFAFAVVVEARVVTQRWNANTPRTVRFTQSLMWVSILSVLAFGESAALQAIRGQELPHWVHFALEYAISAAIGLIILAPAVELFNRGYAEAVALAITAAWLPRLRLLLLERRLYRVLRKFHDLRQKVWRDLEEIRAHNTDLTSAIARTRLAMDIGRDTQMEAGIIQALREAEKRHRSISQRLVSGELTYRVLVMEELERDSSFFNDRISMRRQLAEARTAERHNVIQRILSDNSSMTSRLISKKGFQNDENPDDGGFFQQDVNAD